MACLPVQPGDSVNVDFAGLGELAEWGYLRHALLGCPPRRCMGPGWGL